MPIFSIYSDTPDSAYYGTTPLDGNFAKVLPVGFDFHPVTNAAQASDGRFILGRSEYQGVPVDLKHLPTTVMVDGPKRPLSALLQSRNKFLTSEGLRQVIEELEPDAHQFAPVQLVWKDKSHAAEYFWLYPCASVDAMDSTATTFPMNSKIGTWQTGGSGQFIANRKQVGEHHLWMEVRLPAFGYPFVSETFRYAADKAGLRGIGYSEIPFSD